MHYKQVKFSICINIGGTSINLIRSSTHPEDKLHCNTVNAKFSVSA